MDTVSTHLAAMKEKGALKGKTKRLEQFLVHTVKRLAGRTGDSIILVVGSCSNR